jgi:predicted transcriptional regulator
LTQLPLKPPCGARAAEEDCVKTKEKVQEILDRLPDDCSMDDVLYHLYVVQQIDRGLAEIEAGRTISHEKVTEELRHKWVLGTAG